jgi:NADH:ubiquinone oxidoreductase subunit
MMFKRAGKNYTKNCIGLTMDFVTLITLKLTAVEVGRDGFGNRYYEERKGRRGKVPRRYVRYNGLVEASKVPADWHGWLHHTEPNPPPHAGYARFDWQLDHLPNATGTKFAHRPAGHVLKSGKRPAAIGDYEPWTPS